MTDVERAWNLLHGEGHTCVLCRENAVLCSDARGVRPLLDWYDQGLFLEGFAAADRVVGRGAAFLYILMGISCVHSVVMSQEAATLLEEHGVAIKFEQNPPRILNRDRTGFCPIETAVLGISDPEEALRAIRARLAALRA